VAGFWAELPPGRVACLTGAPPEAVALSLEPLPDDAPATVLCRPPVAPPPARTVAAVLDELETAALDLYPTWLPGAESLAGPGGAGVAAARALARRKASATPHFGPFLADLAARSLDARHRRRPTRFATEVRAAGLARVVADSFGRAHAALLVEVPDGLSDREEGALLAAGEWLAYHGGFAVWLAGARTLTADRVPRIAVPPPAEVAPPPPTGDTREPPTIRFPAPAGLPHPGSRTEQALETALSTRPWAVGRVWNRIYQPDPLTNPIRVDLMWPEERCVIEIDGPEHRSARQYEADRRRDAMLQRNGFAVRRFTNEQVQSDLASVLADMEQLIIIRRLGKD
jgi:very-short-patch-repair endonuclease